MTTEFAYRYAIYFIPTLHSEWWSAGCDWLGRCAASGQPRRQPQIPGVDAHPFRLLTQDPRRYGWHATLKAPFELQPGTSVSSLLRRLQEVAQGLPAFDLPRLQVSTEGGFLALRPETEVSALHTAAAACVTRLHDFAKPLSPADLERRRQSPLTPKQDQLLVQWGYPWVLDEYHFHFSLTGPLNRVTDGERQSVKQAAQRHFEALPQIRFSQIALFAEPAKGADFQWLRSVELQG